MSEIIFECYLVIPHPTRPEILLLQEENGWALPQVGLHGLAQVEGEGWQKTETVRLEAAVRHKYGFEVDVTEVLTRRTNPQTDQTSGIFALKLRTFDLALPLPAGGEWVENATLGLLKFAVGGQRSILKSYLKT